MKVKLPTVSFNLRIFLMFTGLYKFVLDRPDVVCRVFKARLDALLNNLRQGKYFGPHKLGYEVRVIEYQR